MTASSSLHRRERLVAPIAVASGLLVVGGAFLPWLSLFAGLHPMRGVIGLNGRLLAAGGILCLLAGVYYWRHPAPRLGRALAVLAAGLTGFSIWLTIQLFITYHGLRTNPMLVPRLGPGLFIALGGSLAVAVATTAALRRRPDVRAIHLG